MEWLPLIGLVTFLVLYGIIKSGREQKRPKTHLIGSDYHVTSYRLEDDSAGESIPGRDDFA